MTDSAPSERPADPPPWSYWRSRIVFWTVLVHLLATISIYTLNAIPMYRNLLGDYAGPVLVSAQFGLTAIWAGISNASRWRRAAGILFGWPLLVYCTGRPNSPDIWGVAQFLAFEIAFVVGPLLIARSFGVQLFRAAPADAVRLAKTPPRFSIRSLVMLTMGSAILLALGRWLSASIDMTSNAPQSAAQKFLMSLLMAWMYACLALVAVWGMLGAGRVALRAGAVVLVALAASAAVVTTIQRRDFDIPYTFYLFVLAVALVESATLFAVRMAGYRFTRPLAPSDGPAPPDGDPADAASRELAPRSFPKDEDFDASTWV